MSLTLRSATVKDARLLSVLASWVFLDTYATRGLNAALAGEVNDVLSERAFRHRLNDPRVEIELASRDGHLIGFIDLDHGSRCPVEGVEGLEVLRLYVLRDAQRQGVGRALLAHAEAQARAAGCTAVWLTAWEGNTRALAFYAALGFEDRGATPYLIDGQAYVNRVLVRPLGSPGLGSGA